MALVWVFFARFSLRVITLKKQVFYQTYSTHPCIFAILCPLVVHFWARLDQTRTSDIERTLESTFSLENN